jgi:hypothetical protein
MRPSQKAVRCIDWSRVIFDLHGIGMSWREIAVECGYNDVRSGEDDGGKRWVQRLKNLPPTQPDFHSGALLIGLWAARMKRPPSEIPRTEYQFVRNALGRIQALPLVDAPAGQHLQVVSMPQEP